MLGDAGVVQVSPEDSEGLSALNYCDVELVQRLPGHAQLGQPELVGAEPGLDPLVSQQSLRQVRAGRVSPVIVLAGLLLLRDAVVGEVVQARGVYHRVGQRRRLRGGKLDGPEVDNDGGEEDSEDCQAHRHHLPAAVEEAGPGEGRLLSATIL